MFRKLVRALPALLCLLMITPAGAQSAPPWPAEVSIALSQRVKFTSAINGKTYTLRIQVPSFATPPQRGYPVIYVLDGDQYFGAATDINLSISGRNAVVVAIGYDLIGDPALVAKIVGRKEGDTSPIGAGEIGRAGSLWRYEDLTLPVAPENRKPAWQMEERTGGVDAFLKVLESEIKPKVAAIAPVDPANATLWGHSAGGLAVLRALFTEPNAFRTFVASSPAIWWDARAVLAGEKTFSAQVEALKVSPRVLITVGALEEPKDFRRITPGQRAFLKTLTPEQRAGVIAYKRKMDGWGGFVTNARGLANRLSLLHGDKGYRVEFALFAGERHDGAAFNALCRGMHFALEE